MTLALPLRSVGGPLAFFFMLIFSDSLHGAPSSVQLKGNGTDEDDTPALFPSNLGGLFAGAGFGGLLAAVFVPFAVAGRRNLYAVIIDPEFPFGAFYLLVLLPPSFHRSIVVPCFLALFLLTSVRPPW